MRHVFATSRPTVQNYSTLSHRHINIMQSAGNNIVAGSNLIVCLHGLQHALRSCCRHFHLDSYTALYQHQNEGQPYCARLNWHCNQIYASQIETIRIVYSRLV